MTDVGSARPDLLRTVAEATAGAVGEAYLQELVKRVGAAFGGGVCWVSEMLETGASARALACHPAEALPEGSEYPTPSRPRRCSSPRASRRRPRARSYASSRTACTRSASPSAA